MSSQPHPLQPAGAGLELHQRRLRLILSIGTGFMLLMGLGWGMFNALRGLWLVALIDASISLLTLYVFRLIGSRRIRPAHSCRLRARGHVLPRPGL